VRLRRLDMAGFRNLADVVLDLPPEGFALLGNNAQGKSNLLEAIYYLEAFRSFRGARDDQMVKFGRNVFRLVGRLESVDSEPEPAGRPSILEVSVAFQRSPRVKRVGVDGQERERVADGVGRVGAVIFTPDDVRLVADGPQERRQFLDVLLSLNDPSYLSALQRFRQILAQRNAALREGAPHPAVTAWDEGLARWGARVASARGRWIRDSGEAFREYYRAVSGEASARLEYDPGVPGLEGEVEEEPIRDAYHRALGEARDRERRRRTTLAGPQRDEFRIFVTEEDNERDLRAFGSGGQRRTAALALRLLEADGVRNRRNREPLLLLDDVFAELDEGRSERVLELLDRTAAGQVILTAPKESDVRFRRDRLPRWSVRDGRVIR